jgi:PhoPQ-activated pathogenicity-related protein
MTARPRHSARSASRAARRLSIESLEDRRLLAGTPWHNPVYRLDVNKDLVISAADGLAVINRVLSVGTGTLPDPGGNPVPGFYDTSGDNRLTATDLHRIINGLFSRPKVETSFLTPFTADRTPQVTVQVTPGIGDLPDGSLVDLDVDLDNDGDFSDPGELGYMQSPLVNHASVFDLSPALPAGSYGVTMRARVKDSEALVGTSPDAGLQIDTLPSDVLPEYVARPDSSYEYHRATGPGITNPIPGATIAGSYLYYVLDMTSQTWRSTADVNLPVWRHWIELYVPVNAQGQVIADLKETAMLFIDGGSNTSGVPQSPVPDFGLAAAGTKSIVANLKIVPNEPVIFTDETISRTEDAIIAYTFDKFLEHQGEEGNETWPLLLPMVKSAVRAMDSVQHFALTLSPTANVEDFFVAGGSKRGWTTWLTAAVDDRVRAIMPAVYDNLNLGAQMVHHYGAYGFFSQAIDDYQNMNIFDRILTPAGVELARIVDPYVYLNNGRFDDMPKLLLNSPGDEFFVSDSAQFYFHDIPGEQNYLRYIPNTSHSLNAEINPVEAMNSLLGFYDAALNNRELPEFSWTVDQDGTIHVDSETQPSQVMMWQMNNVNVRDFRRLRYPQVFWFNTPLADQGGFTYSTNVQMPATGARAYFVELTFPNPVPGFPAYVFTTEVRVKTQLPLFDWPFASGVPPLASAASSQIASALSTPAVSAGRSTAAPLPMSATSTTATLGATPAAVTVSGFPPARSVAPPARRDPSPLIEAEPLISDDELPFTRRPRR